MSSAPPGLPPRRPRLSRRASRAQSFSTARPGSCRALCPHAPPPSTLPSAQRSSWAGTTATVATTLFRRFAHTVCDRVVRGTGGTPTTHQDACGCAAVCVITRVFCGGVGPTVWRGWGWGGAEIQNSPRRPFSCRCYWRSAPPAPPAPLCTPSPKRTSLKEHL